MVAGRLQEKNGFYYIVLSYTDSAGKRRQPWIGTGLPVKGNKKRAEKMLADTRKDFTIPKGQVSELSPDMAFSDYMRYWLKMMRTAVTETTYSSYCFNVEKHIIPYFEPLGVTLAGVQPRQIQSFYLHEAETLKNTSILRFHANLHKALKYAVRIDLPEGAQVLRVGEDVANIWGLSTDTLPLLCGAVVLILLAATLFSWWLTRRMVQPINHLAEHLDTIEADVPYEELIPLARTIQTDRKLREDNETMRREFTANVSHELKTPLTSISGYAELIETGMAKPADVPTFAARIHKEAQRMIALVSDILQLSELDSTQASHSREPVTEMAPVDLAALVKETAQNMTVNARRAYVTLQYDARPATVRGSRDQLSELTQNLCDNAIRYNRPGGHVELRCGVGGDGCPYFEVEDNGIGIPQDSQTRVFERFYRVDKSRSKATGGTGLGLAIVKHIALLHDAKIDLQSQVGTGTTIRVTFPKNS